MHLSHTPLHEGMNTYMAEIALPTMTDEFLALVPEQRAHVERLMSAGTIASVALSVDRSRLWIAIVASSEHEARAVVAAFPMASHIAYVLTQLAFHELPQLNVTHFSLN